MRLKKFFKQALVVVGFAFLIVACEDDFGSLGTEIVGSVNFETDQADGFTVAAYSKNYAEGSAFTGVQVNNTPVGVLGFYNDPVYGTTTTSLLSQAVLSRYNPDFGDNTVIDSVVFIMPYFSDLEETDEDGNSTYSLDSIFRNTGDMKLSLFRSDYFLNSQDVDSDFEDAAVYFSNEVANFEGREGELIFEHSAFSPSADEVVLKAFGENEDGSATDELEISERLAPRLRLRLDQASTDPNISTGIFDWNEAIIGREGQDVLLNQNLFLDYFRGLYFKVEGPSTTGSQFFFSPSLTNITIYYSFEETTGETNEVNQMDGTIALNLGGVRALQYDNDFGVSPIGSPTFNDTQNITDGEDNLFLKGGDGSVAIIDLFGRDEDGISDELEQLRSCNVLINEANLIFYVDQDALGEQGTGELEPERLFIYDFDNNRVLLDAALDRTVGVAGPIDTRVNHLGRLSREVEDDLSSDGVSYKIRVTQHINNIVKNDSTNVRLALAVSQNVTLDGNARIGGVINEQEDNRVPLSSVISPEGTILHGSASPFEDKRLKLRINYTITEEIDPNSPCGIALGL